MSPKYGAVNATPPAVYSGSFAGMCSSYTISSVPHILLLSFFGATIYCLLQEHFKGIGGKLGMISFISGALVFLIKELL